MHFRLISAVRPLLLLSAVTAQYGGPMYGSNGAMGTISQYPNPVYGTAGLDGQLVSPNYAGALPVGQNSGYPSGTGGQYGGMDYLGRGRGFQGTDLYVPDYRAALQQWIPYGGFLGRPGPTGWYDLGNYAGMGNYGSSGQNPISQIGYGQTTDLGGAVAGIGNLNGQSQLGGTGNVYGQSQLGGTGNTGYGQMAAHMGLVGSGNYIRR